MWLGSQDDRRAAIHGTGTAAWDVGRSNGVAWKAMRLRAEPWVSHRRDAASGGRPAPPTTTAAVSQEDSALSTKSAVAVKPRRGKNKPVLRVSGGTIKGLAEMFGLLADQSRLQILLVLAQEGEMHVKALCELLGQSQPAVSHHLTLLKMKDLVSYRRDGKHNYYRVDSAYVRHLLEQFFADTNNGQKQLQFPDFSLAFKSNGGPPRKG
jgi:ArsR family transcriptional regulator